MRALDVERHREPTYPDSDGQPMADNTLQFRWIATLQGDLDALLPDAFVGGDLLWYPVEGEPRIRMAPDVLVAFGRPKGERGSYKQWEEGGVAPAVVFEVLSPSNTEAEMVGKRAFYERYGVQEYYIVDPDVEVLEVFVRSGERLREVPFAGRHESERLGVTFVREPGRLTLHHPDGTPFSTHAQLIEQRDAAEAQRDAAEAQRDAAEAQRDTALRQAARLAERLRAMGLDPDEPGDE